MNELQGCLQYCQEQNGLPHCKNCGLKQEMIDDIHSDIRTVLNLLKGDCKRKQIINYINEYLLESYKTL